MKTTLQHRLALLITAIVLTAAVAPANAALVEIYSNDFNTRTSVGEIGGSTSFSYATGNLVGSQDVGDPTLTQDSWIRRNTGTAPIVVYDDAGNQCVRFPNSTNYGYALQPIGYSVDNGHLYVSVDMRPPSAWVGSVRAMVAVLGDDEFYQGSTTSGDEYWRQTAGWFGFKSKNATNGDVSFCAYDGLDSGNKSDVFGTTAVATSHWYRFVADLDLATSTYSVNIYDLGTTHPTLSTLTPATPVETLSDLGFRMNMGMASGALNGITTFGLTAFGPGGTTGALYDNVSVSVPEPASLQLLLAGVSLGLLVWRRRARR